MRYEALKREKKERKTVLVVTNTEHVKANQKTFHEKTKVEKC
jgi:hypothetical protein